jgi:hypothetical protein
MLLLYTGISLINNNNIVILLINLFWEEKDSNTTSTITIQNLTDQPTSKRTKNLNINYNISIENYQVAVVRYCTSKNPKEESQKIL